jgi:hypothetical protein
MCLRREPEKYIAGAALDRAALQSSDQCYWLQIQRSRFDSRRYQLF